MGYSEHKSEESPTSSDDLSKRPISDHESKSVCRPGMGPSVRIGYEHISTTSRLFSSGSEGDTKGAQRGRLETKLVLLLIAEFGEDSSYDPVIAGGKTTLNVSELRTSKRIVQWGIHDDE
ncbi:hypothetical protein L484_008244 [Morus notabilis]|uniref:Uncharacterized protein n=1 Tax=Morus notabilis TaxID=981085 RepID=W9RLN0_9ROSA|nr:hypothetical protein L484_008244 [Morus notabilis]